MKSSKKYLIFGLALILAIATGIVAKEKLSTPIPPLTAEEKTKQEADYLAIHPHFGPLVQTQKIKVTFDDEKDLATGSLNSEDLEKIRTKQKVVLYDREDITLPLGGEVSHIDKTTNTITITLPEGTNTSYLAAELDIIIRETVGSKRLPLSALQTDKNGETYVWIAKQNEEQNQFQVQRQTITKGLHDSNYFEEDGHTIQAYDLVILNPNKKIRSDKNYNVVFTEFSAPLHNPIHQAWVDYEVYRLEEEQRIMAKQAEDCFNGVSAPAIPDSPEAGAATVPGSVASRNCAGGNTPDDPLHVFNSLMKIINEGTIEGGGSACGSCGAGGS